MNSLLGPEDLLENGPDPAEDTTIESNPSPNDEALFDLPLGREGDSPEPELQHTDADLNGDWPLKEPTPGSSGLGWWILLLVLLLPVGLYVGYRWNLDPPVLTITQPWIDFGEVRVGQKAEVRALTLSNSGERPLLFDRTVIDGENAGDFAQLGSDCPPELAPQASCVLRLEATPGSDGLRKARLILTGNASNSPIEIALIVNGSRPRVSVEPADLAFGQLMIGTRSPTKTTRLTNSGNAPLMISDIDFQDLGHGAADFVRQSDSCSQRQLQPGESCTLGFRFVPTEAGERSASLRISSDLSGDSPTIRLVGRAQEPPPKLELNVTELDFGLWPVGEETPAQEVDLRNAGRIALRIQEIVSVPESAFRVDVTPCLTAMLAPQESCRLRISFAPAATEAVSETLEVHHDGEGGLASIALSGAGSSPDFAVQPLRLGFGETPFGESSPVKEILFTNPGNARLILSQVTVGGADAPGFSIRPGDCANEVLEPGTSCAIAVRFKPRRSGPHRAELVVRHNAAGGTQTIALSGIGIRARLEAPGALDFGGVELGREERREILLTNSGRAPLALRSVRLQGSRTDDFRLVAENCLEEAVEPGESCRVEIFFQPDRLGSRDVQVRIESNLGTGNDEVRVRATGVEPPKPEIRVQPTTLRFGARALNAPALIETLVISNPGGARLALQSLEIEADHDDFRMASGSCENQPFLEAGKNCTLGVQFIPGASGLRSARLMIRHNAPGSPLIVELEGTGEAPAIAPQPSDQKR